MAHGGSSPGELTDRALSDAEERSLNFLAADVHDTRRASGAIGLQSAHPEDPAGAFVEFRNLKIKRLK